MRPNLDELRAACAEAGEELIRQHLSRLEDRYFESFRAEEICAHLRALSGLEATRPVELLVQARGQTVECTILAFDYPGEFSAITGILAAGGFNVLSGDVFTWEPAPRGAAPERQRERRTAAGRRRRAGVRVDRPDPMLRRRIIDRLSGTLASPMGLDEWAERIRDQLGGVLSILERGGAQAAESARQKVNELVADRLSSLEGEPQAALYPVHIEVDNRSGERTRLRVVSQDTPFFLYALSTALALRSIAIDSVRIRTFGNRIQDEFSFLDAQGRKILDADLLDQVKLSILLTKQFTFFLGSAPDPYAALSRFERLVGEIFSLPQQGRWLDLLSNPLVLRDLARLLGTSDFLWEDFIRLQYETLIPMLQPHLREASFSAAPATVHQRLREALAGDQPVDSRREVLNAFKDREIFLLELDHIVGAGSDLQALADGLTALAQAVAEEAARLTLESLASRFGHPRTVAGLPARYAILGLGKLGGGELGYASDIELLFVYSDAGRTAGPRRIDNGEFFNLLARETAQSITAKREGIFQVDLRLRPYGASGPAAASLESFCRYYGPEGEAHALERLALTRLRAIGGDPQLGAQVERLRDEMIYTPRGVDHRELRRARQRQMDDRVRRGELNAKFSPGALADLEYGIMQLQIVHGADHPEARTPYLRAAMAALERAGVLAGAEAERLRGAYQFLRRLINSLRMLRGNAQDLFLPELDSDEYVHLARRMGYSAGQQLSPAQQLHLEFETQTATVRAFVETHLGREQLPSGAAGNVADLVLSEEVPRGVRAAVLGRAGFRDPERACRNLRGLAGDGSRRGLFARLAVLAVDLLQHQPDADMALNNWERFLQQTAEPEEHFRLLLAQPRRLEILLSLFAGSQFLSDTLIANPEFFAWSTQPERLHRLRSREEIVSCFRELSHGNPGHARWLNALRRYRKRELVRIGIRDIVLGVPIQEVMQELSALAESLIQVSLERIWLEEDSPEPAERLCVVAFGKLGGGELNYSSDVDLLVICASGTPPEERAGLQRHAERLRADLSSYLEEGHAYRVDFRLRPYGSSGELVNSLEGVARYYQEEAGQWELQALLKARPVAGDRRIGRALMAERLRLLSRRFDPGAVRSSILELRRAARGQEEAATRRLRGAGRDNIKLGPGGIRDVEFLVQGLQLLHLSPVAAGAGQDGGGEAAGAGAAGGPAGAEGLLSGGTLPALEALRQAGVLAGAEAEELRRDYLFLRRIEHYLQIFEDRQTHTLPADRAQLEALAARLGIGGAEELLERLARCRARVEARFRAHLEEAGRQGSGPG